MLRMVPLREGCALCDVFRLCRSRSAPAVSLESAKKSLPKDSTLDRIESCSALLCSRTTALQVWGMLAVTVNY